MSKNQLKEQKINNRNIPRTDNMLVTNDSENFIGK